MLAMGYNEYRKEMPFLPFSGSDIQFYFIFKKVTVGTCSELKPRILF